MFLKLETIRCCYITEYKALEQFIQSLLILIQDQEHDIFPKLAIRLNDADDDVFNERTQLNENILSLEEQQAK